MLCQNCHKNEATIHVQQIVDGKIQAFHLCEECAAEKGIQTPQLDDFNLAEVLFDIAGKVAKPLRILARTAHGVNVIVGIVGIPAFFGVPAPRCGEHPFGLGRQA